MEPECPFKVGEIAVFKSAFRFETYVARVQPIHIEYWGSGFIPEMRKATIEEKEQWYNANKSDLVLETHV